MSTVISREYAKDLLGGKINRESKHLDGLKVLMDVIPWDSLSKEQETSLWHLFCRVWN